MSRVCKAGFAIEEALGSAQDVEGAIEENGEITVVQTRPQMWLKIYSSDSHEMHDTSDVWSLVRMDSGLVQGQIINWFLFNESSN